MRDSSPLHFELLLWYHCRADKWDGCETETSTGYREHLLEAGLIRATTKFSSGFITTTHGKRVVDQLCLQLASHF